MKRFILKKVLLGIVIILIVVILSFFLLHVIPGSPFQTTKILSPEIQKKMDAYYGLDRPLIYQLLHYLSNIFRLDFGFSYQYQGVPVFKIISETFPVSALIGLQAFIIGFPSGIVLGILSAKKSNKTIGKSTFIFSIIFTIIPLFILATLLQYLFSTQLKIFPSGQWKGYYYSVLPSLILSLCFMANKIRQARTLTLAIMNEEYYKVAQTYDLPKYYFFWHYELRNIITPILATTGIELVGLLMGSVVIEQIFALPGIGNAFLSAINNLDYPLILGIIILYSTLIIIITTITDIINFAIDPRTKIDVRKSTTNE
ncbi:ABC transporter permease [Candidatus Saccharibacteria bacterium]|nr:ABC transporter permease [Candidatus Saccharibacteria bacterium]